jgi:hypothetical protein
LGYTTDFNGRFLLNKPLDEETYQYLIKFNETRRMARNVDKQFGIEGEFYVDGNGFKGQDDDPTIINYNKHPSTQPSLWCQWKPSEDHLGIEWDGCEKFHCYVEWLLYILKSFLLPKGYTLSGIVKSQGEDPEDHGELDGELLTGEAIKLGGVLKNPNETIEAQPKRKVVWEE